MPRAYRIAGFLRFAAIEFVVLTACAMVLYAGGTWFDPQAPHYQLAGNFLSDLGMTRAFSGESNLVSSVLFGIALTSIGSALIAFAWTWRDFAFTTARAVIAGMASAMFGTLSGLCFIGVAFTPFDRLMMPHNLFVIAAFSLLLLYVLSLTIAMWRNAIGGLRLGANLAYLALVVGYMILILFGPRLDTEAGHRTQVIGQKTIVYGSMLHVIYLTTSTRTAIATFYRRQRA